jgi:hypothetical protein
MAACTHDATAPTAAPVTCALTFEGEEVSGSNWLVTWRYAFSGVRSATFRSEPFASDNLDLFSSPGFVRSTHPRRTSVTATQFTFNVSLRAGTCAAVERFTN